MTLPRLGVVIVTYASADVIEGCLGGLLASTGVALRIVVVDNASPDASAEAATAMSKVAEAPHTIEILPTGANLGFAGGVNRGLEQLLEDEGLDRFWILNPDTVPKPGAAAAFATHPAPDGFAMIGGRVLYADPPHRIQIDGGTISRRSGKTGNVNQGRPADTPAPQPDQIDFVTGASLVASRAFIETAGLMAEDYFLYYEEVDWALRRGDMPLLYCPDAVVEHAAGTAIGSPKPGRAASPFSLWFKHRARLMFVRRHLPGSLVSAHAFTFAKAVQSLLHLDMAGAWAILAGGLGVGPPASVKRRLRGAAFRP